VKGPRPQGIHTEPDSASISVHRYHPERLTVTDLHVYSGPGNAEGRSASLRLTRLQAMNLRAALTDLLDDPSLSWTLRSEDAP
jgi:hypothetical protein